MARINYANGHNSDMFYEIKMSIPDKFFYIEIEEQKYIFLDHRELDVFKGKNKNSQIEAIQVGPFIEKAVEIKENTTIDNRLAMVLLKEYNLCNEELEVPVTFPLDMADYLRSKGVKLKPVNPFYPSRRNKTESEIKNIKQSLEGIYKAYDRIKEVLSEAKIKGDKLIFENEILTSEFLKQEVDKILLANDLVSNEGLIISSGDDSAIPHHEGAGVIRPYTTIICDIFPQNRTTKYFGDLTRTFVKGEPTSEILKMYNAVLKAQKSGIAALKAGIKCSEIHDVCVQIFLKEGFDVVGDKGFIHGTGHSIGVDIHEGPYLNKTSQDVLEPGNVVTVEPGLYYPGIGGVRIEDDVLVTKDGFLNLTNYSKEMIIL